MRIPILLDTCAPISVWEIGLLIGCARLSLTKTALAKKSCYSELPWLTEKS